MDANPHDMDLDLGVRHLRALVAEIDADHAEFALAQGAPS